VAAETDIYLSLGSNLGDRRANLSRALGLLDESLGVGYDALSSVIETPAWGFEGEPFLNCVVRYILDKDKITPASLLSVCKKAEHDMGRREALEFNPETGRRIYHNRVIDIDILLFGGETVNTPTLTIPHPLMKERDFVMKPLMEIYRPK